MYLVLTTVHAYSATFAQRYGANSYIFNHPLYFKKIDPQGHIIRDTVELTERQHMRKLEKKHYQEKGRARKMHYKSKSRRDVIV